MPLPNLVAWFASFHADVLVEFVAPEDAMMHTQDFGYTQNRFETCISEHLPIAKKKRFPSGTRTIHFVRRKHAG